MRYRAFQGQTDIMAPARLAAALAGAGLAYGPAWLRQAPLLSHAAAGWEMLSRAGLTHKRPDYGFRETIVDGEAVPVREEIVAGTVFGDLVRFRKEGDSSSSSARAAASSNGSETVSKVRPANLHSSQPRSDQEE